MTHFDDPKHIVTINLSIKPATSGGLRHCQVGALCAITSHFSVENEPAIVALPTGCGKTAVLLAAPYLLASERVLFVTPSVVLREQAAHDAENFVSLKRIGLANASWSAPKVHEVQKQLANLADWNDLRNYDLVVALPNSVSPGMKNVYKDPPKELFDLILIDEAHHRPSKTWDDLISAFPDAKVIMVTATPFRGDRIALSGKLVYSYSLTAALKNGDLVNIKLKKITAAADIDKKLAKEAEKIFNADKVATFNHRLVARVDSIARATEVLKIYEKETKLKLEKLDSTLSRTQIDDTMGKLRTGSLHGIVCVDMLNEGFDLPNLKIGVVHDQHKSLVPTVQFIGRFLRTGGCDIGTAKLVTQSGGHELTGYQLYRSESILSTAADLIERQKVESQLTTDVASELERQAQISPRLDQLIWESLKPYCQVRIFKSKNVDFTAKLDFARGFKIIYRHHESALQAMALITKVETKPNWFTMDGLTTYEYDLVLVHFDTKANLVFVCWTAKTDSTYKDLILRLCPAGAVPVPLTEMRRVLLDVSDTHFFSIGLANGLYGAADAYRTLAGPAAEHAVLESDARQFHYSHLFGKGTESGNPITIGFSKSAKAWSSRRVTVPEFVQWCNTIAKKIQSKKTVVTHTHLDDLSMPSQVSFIPDHLLGGILSADSYREAPMVVKLNSSEVPITECLLACTRTSNTEVTINISHNGDSENVTLDVTRNPLFSSATNSFQVRQGRTLVPLNKYFELHPPNLFFWDFSQLEKNQLWKPNPASFVPFKAERGVNLSVEDWKAKSVDIEVEVDFDPTKPAHGTVTIHDYLRTALRAQFDIVFYNQGSAEYADFICVNNKTGLVALYHCKGSTKPKPGFRQDDLKEVFLQALNSIHWIRKREAILKHVRERDGKSAGRKNKSTKRGFEKPTSKGIQVLETILMDKTKHLKYEIVIVQPGLSLERMERVSSSSNDMVARRLLEGFAGLQDTVKRAGAAISFLCTENAQGY